MTKKQREICEAACPYETSKPSFHKRCYDTMQKRCGGCTKFWREAYRRDRLVIREIRDQVSCNIKEILQLDAELSAALRREAALLDSICERYTLRYRTGEKRGKRLPLRIEMDRWAAWALHAAGWWHDEQGRLVRK